ncbi:sensor histidine kinase, PAS domain-containing [Desulfuromonas soudanensis]|uniref:Sensor histidine kinase, PAS domain-containing n=1 Tax=Desulfuromonas soudanensis TaxID=1603606 RepID=A0A0M4CXH6_9BACT|nr:PAS domain-containing protein [Desulfuromonas soudanensis]ALC14902.1 sensor histidine kinase, PAS domain-containing [Desulfuromonas soudanensis]
MGKKKIKDTVDRDPAADRCAATELRRRAEEQLLARAAVSRVPRNGQERRQIVHELEVHQIELEMQNAVLRQARDEIEIALDKYTDLYDFAPVGYLTLNKDGIIGDANFTAASHLGIGRNRLVGKRFESIVAPGSREEFSTFLSSVFAGQSKQICEVALLNCSAQSIFVQVEALPSASGLDCRVALIDISRRRSMEEQMERQHAELAVAKSELQAVGQTSAMELCRPMTVFRATCRAVRKWSALNLDVQAHECLRGLNKVALRMNRLLSSLLDFSRRDSRENGGSRPDHTGDGGGQ